MCSNVKHKNNNEIQLDRLCFDQYILSNNYEFKKMKYTEYVKMLFQ